MMKKGRRWRHLTNGSDTKKVLIRYLLDFIVSSMIHLAPISWQLRSMTIRMSRVSGQKELLLFRFIHRPALLVGLLVPLTSRSFFSAAFEPNYSLRQKRRNFARVHVQIAEPWHTRNQSVLNGHGSLVPNSRTKTSRETNSCPRI